MSSIAVPRIIQPTPSRLELLLLGLVLLPLFLSGRCQAASDPNLLPPGS
jgi:hypothetical protein